MLDLSKKKLFLLDMDGTLYLGDRLFEGALEFLRRVRETGGRYLFATNNSSRSVTAYVDRLRGMGIDAAKEDFLTSTDALIWYLRGRYDDALIYAFGTRTFRHQLREAGFRVTDQREAGISLLVCGFDTELTFQKLEDACMLLGDPTVDFLATNPDWVCPTAWGFVPDCGSVCEMLFRATGRRPRVIGKPEPEMALLAMERWGYSKEETLLVEAAGRPGAVGRKMTELLMRDRCNIDYAAYCNACKRAIDINDPEKVLSMMVRAQASVPQLEPSFFGEMASYAHSDHRFIAKEIIKRCGEEQIAAAPSFLLEQFAMDKDFRTLSALVEKGISGGGSSARTLHMLTYEGRDSWIAEELLEKRMWVDANDYSALHACVQNDAVEVCRLLLDGGMDFDQYRQWAQTRPCAGHEETLQALADHWSEMQAEVEQAPAQENGGMTLG